jgi:CheY-like chemotaxis protein
LAAKSLETVRLTEALSIAPEDESARSALAAHLGELRQSAAEHGLSHLEAALSEVMTGLEREVFSPASLRAVRVLAWRYEPLATLPGQSGTHPVAPQPGDSSLSGRRILVADDESEVRWFYVGVLREAGARVIEARDGIEALELARAEPPDAILADIVMPRLDGLALCAAVRREPLLDGVPVVLLSWRDDFLHRMRELRADAQGYLRKEVPEGQVLDRVTSVLEPLLRLERSLSNQREARGDLEELGVARLLAAVRRHRPDASIVVQDPWSLFELQLRDGHIVGVTRTAIDGAVTKGHAAFPALVGMSSGRFVVAEQRPREDAQRGESLDEAFSAASRRLGSFLNTIAAHPNCRVEFDPDVLGTYVRHSPIRVQRLVAALVAGGPPDVLWESGAGSRALVDALLVTLARQGAVRDVKVPEESAEGPPDAPVADRSEPPVGRAEELNERENEQDSSPMSDPAERQDFRAQSEVAMHREPANRISRWSYPVWRLHGGQQDEAGQSNSGFGMEIHATSRLFGLAFIVLLAATVGFLVWDQVAPVASPQRLPDAPPAAPPLREAKGPTGDSSIGTVPVPELDQADRSKLGGRLRAGVHPSAGATESQGVLELLGSAEVRVEVDGVDQGTLPLRLALDEGVHRVRYRSGSRAFDRFYYVKPGATRAIEVVTQAGGFVDAR